MNFKTILFATCLFPALTALARENVVVPDSLGTDRALGASPASALSGKVSGVRVSSVDGNLNGLLNVNIRGVNSLRSDSQPLWIVDGAVLNTSANSNLDAFWQWGENGYASPLNTLSALSLYDIASIEVVKNASATAMYGAAGANGVIIITTKNPSGDKLSVDWHSNVGLSFPRINNSAFGPGFSHDHHVSVVANKNNTNYYLSANVRDISGVTPAAGRSNVGVRLGFDCRANSSVSFGMKTMASMGRNSNSSGVGKFGTSSLMSTIRTVTAIETADGWIADYDNYSDDYRFDLSIYLNVKIAEGLVWKNNLGVDYHFLNRYFWFGNGTFFGLTGNGAASILSNSLFSDTFNSSLNFERFFGKHHLRAAAGYEQNAQMRKYNQVPATDFFDHSLRAKSINLSSTMVLLNRHQLDIFRNAAFVTADYDWNGAAGVNMVARAEFISKYFDMKPQVYGGAQAFVDFAKFGIDGLDDFSSFRVEGGWGTSGWFNNRDLPFGGGIEEGTEPFYSELQHLRSSEINLGLKLGFADNRYNFAVSGYRRSTSDNDDIFCFGKNKPNKLSVGGDYMWDYDERFLYSGHSSTIENSGVEIDFSGDLVRSSSLVWNVSANVTFNDNRFSSVAVEDAAGPDLGSGLVANAAVKGEQVGAIYGYDRADGVFRVLGNSIPKLFGGLTSTLRAGAFSAEIQFDGAAGASLANLNLLMAAQEAPYGLESAFVEKADFLRLSRVAVGYEFNICKLKCIKSVGLNLSANNLYTLTNYSGWNPDVNVFGLCPASAGMDYASYPTFSSVVLGVNVKF